MKGKNKLTKLKKMIEKIKNNANNLTEDEAKQGLVEVCDAYLKTLHDVEVMIKNVN